MKKLILAAGFSLATLALNAQIKVHPGGGIALGFTSQAPLYGFKMQLTGNSVFSASTSTITSAAFIRGNNAYSEASMANSKGPDYTWASDDITGIFHPAAWVIGFSSNGTEAMRVHSNGNIGIGTTTPTSLFSIKGSGNSAWTAYFNNPQTVASATGVYATVATPSTTVSAYCLYGTISAGGGYNHGVKGSAYNSSMQSTGQAFGVYGQAGGATTGYNFGVVGRLLGSNYGAGVFGCDNNNSEGYVGGSYAGYFVGKVRTTNDSPEKPTSGSWTGYSDIRLKKDTASFKQGMEVIRKIHPITYKFTGAGNLPSQTINIGVSAQDIETVAPYCVSSGKLVMTQSESSNFGADVIASLPADSAGISRAIVNVKTFNYDPLIYISINALNQLDSTVTALKKELIDTKTLLQSAIQSGGIKVDKNENSEDRKSNNSSTSNAKLWQNNPNPFNQTTTIKCFIPEQSKVATLLIFDMNGTLKKSIPVNGKGETSVTINSKEFIAGMYHYSLIIDGQEIDTKKMILTE